MHYHLGFYTILYWQEYHLHCAFFVPPNLGLFCFFSCPPSFFVFPSLPSLCVEHQVVKAWKAVSCMSICSFSVWLMQYVSVAGYSWLENLPGRRQPQTPFPWGGFPHSTPSDLCRLEDILCSEILSWGGWVQYVTYHDFFHYWYLLPDFLILCSSGRRNNWHC